MNIWRLLVTPNVHNEFTIAYCTCIHVAPPITAAYFVVYCKL